MRGNQRCQDDWMLRYAPPSKVLMRWKFLFGHLLPCLHAFSGARAEKAQHHADMGGAYGCELGRTGTVAAEAE